MQIYIYNELYVRIIMISPTESWQFIRYVFLQFEVGAAMAFHSVPMEPSSSTVNVIGL